MGFLACGVAYGNRLPLYPRAAKPSSEPRRRPQTSVDKSPQAPYIYMRVQANHLEDTTVLYRPAAMICFVALLLVVGCATEAPRPPRRKPAPVPRENPIRKVTNWLCYYGDDRGVFSVPDTQFMVLDADTLGMVTDQEKAGRILLAYISLGEAEDFRWYWPEVKGASWILDENPNWAGDHYVDPRSPEWRDLVVKRIAPRLLRKGYDGFMLDTLDTVDALLNNDPLAYEGAARGMVDIVKALREAYPDATIVANGGLSIVRGMAPYLDAVMYEGVRSTYDFGSKTYRRRTEGEAAWIKDRLARVTKAKLPLLALEYVNLEDADAVKSIKHEVRSLGYLPFISEISLHTYPGQKKAQ